MKSYKQTSRHMGSMFEMILHHEDEDKAVFLLDLASKEIQRIEDLLSEFKHNSVTSQINQSAGISDFQCGSEVFQLIKRANQISELSYGMFDISISPLKKLYMFKNSDFEFPSQNSISRARDLVSYKKIHLNENTQSVFLSELGMSISFAAIGKGYAADQVKKIWIENEVVSGVISASGDMNTIGNKSNGEPWSVGIPNPTNKEEMIVYIPLINNSIATSGDYEQFFIYDDKKFSHNINPLTGYPVDSITSVSIISPAAELSDALATAVTIMGVEEGLSFVNQLPETHCIIVDSSKTVHFSNNIQLGNEH